MRYFWILTLQKTGQGPFTIIIRHSTFTGVIAASGGETAEEIYLRALDQCQQKDPSFIEEPVTIFWSMTRNELT